MLMLRSRTRAFSVFAFTAGLLAPSIANAQDYFNAPTLLSSDTLWTNYLQLSDLDGDGDLDVVVANCSGFFSTPGKQAFQVFTNDGSGAFTDGTAAVLGAAFEKPVREFAIGDVDGDGKVDLYVPDAGGGGPDRLYMGKPSGPLVDEASTRLPSGLASTAGATRFGDFDGDGDLDLIVVNGYSGPDNAKLYLNDGTGKFAELLEAFPALSGGTNPDDVDLGDFDRDYDIDVVINMHSGNNSLLLNDGAGKFAAGSLPSFPGSAYHYGPAACDVDGDTDVDLWVDNVASGYGEMLLINGGTANFTNQTAANVTGNPGADDNGAVCVDIDHDGDMDMAIPSLVDEERVLRNDGTGKFTHIGGFPAQGDPTLWLDFGDVNGDGKLDAVTGQGEDPNISTRVNRVYLGSTLAPVDGTPPKIILTETPASGNAVRFAVSDGVVSDTGPRLKRAFLKLSAPAAAEIDARYLGADLFRGVIDNQPAGTSVTFTACAVDREDNEGCGQPVTFTTSGGGSGGAGGTAGSASGGSAGGGNASGSGGTGTGGTGGTGTGGSAGNSFAPASDDGGCGCRVASDDTSKRGLSLVGLMLGLWLVRRAKRNR
jgi:MYXO-CTERM domain-containing protein